MAKGHPLNAGYIPGDHWTTCQRCGLDRRSSKMAKEWTGLIVCKDTCWESRHPQDFVRSKKEDTSAKGLVTSRPADVYVNNPYTLTLETASYTYSATSISDDGIATIEVSLDTASYAYSAQDITDVVGTLVALDTATYAYTAQPVTATVVALGKEINLPGFGYLTTGGSTPINIPGFGYFTE